MKKAINAKLSVLLALILSFAVMLAGCWGGDDDENQEPATYTIQYTDDAGTHTLTVTGGMPYSLESLPQRFGYEFLGLYDSQTGGTQYVGANGASLAPYSDRANKVLFPQFKAIDYTVVLDYQGAQVTGERSLTVPYGSAIPELPKNLTLEHNVFTGWYTEAGSKGEQIADSDGNLPIVSVLNEQNFKLDDSRRITLFAGFDLEKYKVTFNFDGGLQPEEVMVPYGTPIKNVVPKTRNSEGKAGLLWSDSESDEQKEHLFDGEITGEKTLYVAEWAPVIDFNVDGGEEVIPVVAREGDQITLPTPVKYLAKFLRWETPDGQPADITRMPANGAKLKAVWQAKIEFDENGGEDVTDISEQAGTSITLPTPEKEGYLFAGWYTDGKEKYESSKMPSEGIALKAGWYKEKETKIVIKTAEDDAAYSGGMDDQGETSGPSADWRREVDLSNYLPSTGATVHIQINLKMATNQAKDVAEGGFYIYDASIVSASNLIGIVTATVSSTSYKSYVLESDLVMKSNTLYLCYFAKKLDTSHAGWTKVYFSDIWINLIYPDLTYLYL